MQTLQNGYQGLSLLLMLNWDRLLVVAALLVGLSIGAWVREF